MLYPPPPGTPIVVIGADPRAFDVGRSDAPERAARRGAAGGARAALLLLCTYHTIPTYVER